MLSTVKDTAVNAWQGAKNIGHMVADPAKTGAAMGKAKRFLDGITQNLTGLETSLKEAQNFVYNQGMKQTIGQILQTLGTFKQNGAQVSKQLQEIEMNLKQTTVPTGGQGGGQPAPTNASPAPAPAPAATQETFQQMKARHAQEEASHPASQQTNAAKKTRENKGAAPAVPAAAPAAAPTTP